MIIDYQDSSTIGHGRGYPTGLEHTEKMDVIAESLPKSFMSIAQYGNQTGNYIAQAEMQVAMEGVNNILSVALATAAGFKYGQAPGAIIGAAIATGNIAINYFNQYRTLQTNIAKLDTYANKMRERAGTISSNGSRGTDY